MFDDVGKMRNDARRLSNNVGKDGTTTWKNCWKNVQHFWRNTACAEGGTQKMPPKRRHWLYGFTREVTEMFGVHKLDVWSLNTILKVL